MNSILNIKLSLPIFIICCFLASGATYIFALKSSNEKIELLTQEQAEKELLATDECNYNVDRMSGYKYIKPLMFVDRDCEAASLKPIKLKILHIIDSYKASQNLNQASVYIRDFNSTSWTAINPQENYEPGSLFKVPILFCFLKMNEIQPGILNRKLRYEVPFENKLNVAFKSKSIQVGKSYTIRELLKYMIVYSDNNATMLLNQNIQFSVLTRIFSDLDLPLPEKNAAHYYFTVSQYSMFMRAIYNACYLNTKDSQYAAELLTQAVFNKGIRNAIPKPIPIAHKFGESGNTDEIQLHESAIVYLHNRPFLLTIMTKGKDNQKLAKLMSDITDVVYEDFAK